MPQSSFKPSPPSPTSVPGLYRDPSFWGLAWTQFLGAFNDNLFKQIILLLAVPASASAVAEEDAQATAAVVFALPFVMFSGIAGFLSDKFSKRTIIVWAKIAEIVVMAMGLVGFLMFARSGYVGLLMVLFLMGAQSAFFGPGKYGILPELFRSADLPAANGFILMTTFLAIILGAVTAGVLGDLFIDRELPLAGQASRLWVGSAACILIAVVGTATSLVIRSTRPADPALALTASSFTIPGGTRRALSADRPLMMAIVASSVFWLVCGIAQPTINSLGLIQLQVDMKRTSLLLGVISIGIALGAVLAGKLVRGDMGPRLASLGLWGIVLWLLFLSVSHGGRHWLGFGGSLPVLVMLGVSAGLFAIPIQVFIQSRPSTDQKGRMIAVMNQANFMAILLSGVVYGIFDRIAIQFGWPRSSIFAMMALLALPIAVWYRLPALSLPEDART
jgi:acyl-[acyl-carrier-protein]-phospholipid O-acyltransferase/long-chain-fatty-acid--[acyl-carrier-protein] ligase